MSTGREAAIARRMQLLELEAQLQRTALAGSFRHLEKPGILDLLASVGGYAGRLLALPELRWLLVTSLWRALSRRRPRE